MKQQKPLTREQYLKKFTRAVRWRLPPQESEEAISDYRELVLEEARDENRLVEELGEPIQAAHLLTDVRTYRRWLKVFAVLTFGLFLMAKWAFTGGSQFTYVLWYRNYWFPVWVMAVGLVLSLYWFRRHGQKNGPLSKWLFWGLALVFVVGAVVAGLTWHVTDPKFFECLVAEPDAGSLQRQVWLLGDLLMYGGCGCALTAFAGLVLAKCYDRRWLALYALALTVAALCVILVFLFGCMDVSYGADDFRNYFFPRMIPVGIIGLLGTGVALC